jgi:L-aminopeptidase/D-esterase-like protein
MNEIDIKKLSAFKIGHAQNETAKTGVSVVLCEKGGFCGVDIRGGSPATLETAKLNPVFNSKYVHGITLTGGSSFGLQSAFGVMKFLEERKIGRDVGVTVVPNVVAGSLFDLKVGDWKIRPDIEMGYHAAQNAFANSPVLTGKIGVGIGCTFAKTKGKYKDGGVGIAAFQQNDLMVDAIVAVNSVGDIGNYECEMDILSEYKENKDLFADENTVLAVVMTNANLNKADMTRIAGHGQNGIARAIRPAHTVFDGDICFAICSGEINTTQDAVGILANRAVEAAIYNSVTHG